MVDWNGLFKWSMQQNDGTKPSNFKQMSPEDAKWLEEAMKQHTFSDTDRLKEIIDQLKEWSSLAAGNDAKDDGGQEDQQMSAAA